MPHLHDEEKPDNDEASHVSSGSKSAESGSKGICPATESAAKELLSLATLAEKHAKSNASAQQPSQSDDADSVGRAGLLTSGDAHPSSEAHFFAEESRHLPPRSPGMGPRWGVVAGHHPPPRFHGFARHGVMPRMYPGPMGGPAVGGPMGEHPPYIRRAGGYPMWSTSPRPPYHRVPGSPSPLPHSFRGAVPPHMARQCSANDDDSSVSSGTKRSNASYPAKSILKKPRVESTAASSCCCF